VTVLDEEVQREKKILRGLDRGLVEGKKKGARFGSGGRHLLGWRIRVFFGCSLRRGWKTGGGVGYPLSFYGDGGQS